MTFNIIGIGLSDEKDISVKRIITDEDGPGNLSIDGVAVKDLSALRIPVDTKYSLILSQLGLIIEMNLSRYRL